MIVPPRRRNDQRHAPLATPPDVPQHDRRQRGIDGDVRSAERVRLRRVAKRRLRVEPSYHRVPFRLSQRGNRAAHLSGPDQGKLHTKGQFGWLMNKRNQKRAPAGRPNP